MPRRAWTYLCYIKMMVNSISLFSVLQKIIHRQQSRMGHLILWCFLCSILIICLSPLSSFAIPDKWKVASSRMDYGPVRPLAILWFLKKTKFDFSFKFETFLLWNKSEKLTGMFFTQTRSFILITSLFEILRMKHSKTSKTTRFKTINQDCIWIKI